MWLCIKPANTEFYEDMTMTKNYVRSINSNDRLDNGAEIIALHLNKLTTRREGVVLAKYGHEYCIWNCHEISSQLFTGYYGHYFSSIENAIKCYKTAINSTELL